MTLPTLMGGVAPGLPDVRVAEFHVPPAGDHVDFCAKPWLTVMLIEAGTTPKRGFELAMLRFQLPLSAHATPTTPDTLPVLGETLVWSVSFHSEVSWAPVKPAQPLHCVLLNQSSGQESVPMIALRVTATVPSAAAAGGPGREPSSVHHQHCKTLSPDGVVTTSQLLLVQKGTRPMIQSSLSSTRLSCPLMSQKTTVPSG